MSASTTGRARQSLESCEHWGPRDIHFPFCCKWVEQSFDCCSGYKCQFLSCQLYLLLRALWAFRSSPEKKKKKERKIAQATEGQTAAACMRTQSGQGFTSDCGQQENKDTLIRRASSFISSLKTELPINVTVRSGNVPFHVHARCRWPGQKIMSTAHLYLSKWVVFCTASQIQLHAFKSESPSEHFSHVPCRSIHPWLAYSRANTRLSWRVQAGLQPDPTSCLPCVTAVEEFWILYSV